MITWQKLKKKIEGITKKYYFLSFHIIFKIEIRKNNKRIIKAVILEEINLGMKLSKEGKNIKYNFHKKFKRYVSLKTGKCIIVKTMMMTKKKALVVS